MTQDVEAGVLTHLVAQTPLPVHCDSFYLYESVTSVSKRTLKKMDRGADIIPLATDGGWTPNGDESSARCVCPGVSVLTGNSSAEHPPHDLTPSSWGQVGKLLWSARLDPMGRTGSGSWLEACPHLEPQPRPLHPTLVAAVNIFTGKEKKGQKGRLRQQKQKGTELWEVDGIHPSLG
ncbi:hypothetical protein E2C01_039103 [Portunus trituberculatus]|uniref:Uncharacterized protein n=1 Tax=Portunus trituberculatus TaxID=210409 RepID=A0A5B7FLU7_PORTR|nr:hypothetical protein [Portunus trituberculatus]